MGEVLIYMLETVAGTYAVLMVMAVLLSLVYLPGILRDSLQAKDAAGKSNTKVDPVVAEADRSWGKEKKRK